MSDRPEVIFLCTGTSHGVPMIGCECDVCRSDDPRDFRTTAVNPFPTPPDAKP